MRILLSNSSSESIYEQIARQVRAQIIAGDLQEGALLPSIRALAHDLQISVITTKRAYEELEKEGLIDTVGGKGTFVAAQNSEFLREIYLAGDNTARRPFSLADLCAKKFLYLHIKRNRAFSGGKH